MEHSEAVEQMAAEKYLLDELPPDLRDAFEEHVFDCPECALDLRAGAAFVDEAKVQLPDLTAAKQVPAEIGTRDVDAKKQPWFSWWRPLFANPLIAGPVFAALLVIVGYQNLILFPGLRNEADAPRLSPVVALHAGMRGGAHKAIDADRRQGVTLLVDLPQLQGYSSYAFDLYDPQGKLVWTHSVPASQDNGAGDGPLSLAIPGRGLQQGSYVLAVSGLTANGGRREVERQSFDIRLHD